MYTETTSVTPLTRRRIKVPRHLPKAREFAMQFLNTWPDCASYWV